MEEMEDIYVNVELQLKQQQALMTPQTGSKRINKRLFWGVTGALVLLSFSLLTAFIVINVRYGFSTAELSAVKNNLNEMLENCNFKIANLTEERNRLNASLIERSKEILKLQKKTCPEGWNMSGSSCYFFSSQSSSWDVGREDCRRRGADLVVIESQSENEFLGLLIKKRPWIGLSDREEEGTWKWVNGAPLNFTPWRQDQPDNGGGDPQWGEEDCIQIVREDLKWNDLSCEASLVWICEKSAAPLL